ncbi:hypothetical protein DVH24_026408 [Malus domestica]|uniref:Uncharacterized protein n=1 Tax=Malus domestica TaxID=3750 RepID=A0A498KNJ5_MALDO|nr:hypothetical protein DVH24_026408 [Malus domestica]
MTKTSDCISGDDVEVKSGTSGTTTMVQSARFEIEKFDGTNNFLYGNVRHAVFEENEEWERLNAHAYVLQFSYWKHY